MRRFYKMGLLCNSMLVNLCRGAGRWVWHPRKDSWRKGPVQLAEAEFPACHWGWFCSPHLYIVELPENQSLGFRDEV